MIDRLPEQVFQRPALTEAPQTLAIRPERNEVITTYNHVFDNFMVRRTILLRSFNNGEFSSLGQISAKSRSGQVLDDAETALIRDYATLLDAQAAFYGRRNVNAANLVRDINIRESQGYSPTDPEITSRNSYQAGDFYQIPDSQVSHPIRGGITEDRFELPVRDGDKPFAIFDGAPVEGMIRFIDQELTRELAQDNYGMVQNLRRQRDVLYTSSTQIYSDEASPVFKARNEYESYMHSIDEMRKEWILPDWLNAENVLRERRVLNIPQQRGSNRWATGCLPLLIPLPIILCLGLNVYSHPCAGTGGELRLEVFDSQGNNDNSVRGSIEREMAALAMGEDQSVFRYKDDAALVRQIDEIRASRPSYYRHYIDIAESDYLETGQRFKGVRDESPWIRGTDFSPRESLGSCLGPEVRDERANTEVERENNPQWYHPIQRTAENFRRFLPRPNFWFR